MSPSLQMAQLGFLTPFFPQYGGGSHKDAAFKLKFKSLIQTIQDGLALRRKRTIFEGRVVFVVTRGNMSDSSWKCGCWDEMEASIAVMR